MCIRFVNKRSQRKRQREEGSIKENEEKSSGKRPKRDGNIEDVKSNKTETDEKVSPDGKSSTVKGTTTLCVTEDVKKHKTDEEEDPKEVEESPDVAPQLDWATEARLLYFS